MRLYCQVDVPPGSGAHATPGFVTLGDGIHDSAAWHASFLTATLNGEHLRIADDHRFEEPGVRR